RYHHCAAFDGEQVVVFGGLGPASADTWRWDGSEWTDAAPSTLPPLTDGCTMAYHAANDEVVMFTRTAQTWIWDGADWSQRTPATSPPALYAAVMASDDARSQVILFGGALSGTVQDKTW